MIKKKRLINLTVAMAVFSSLNGQVINGDKILLKPGSPKIEYEGRIGMSGDSIAEIYWPGSSFKIYFRGTEVSAIIGEQRMGNYYNVIIDNDSQYVLKSDTSRTTYTLASNLRKGKHTVQLFRRTGWNGVTRFYGAEFLPGTKIIRPGKHKQKRIEFYGNSITVGSGMYVHGSAYGSENNYLSYAAVTARHYHARYTCIARSGIGLLVSWFPMVMPELYSRLNPFDSTSVWDFTRSVPDIVVVNLFQNDFSIITSPGSPEFKSRFGSVAPSEDSIISAYRTFIQHIRNYYPKAAIICVLGNMDAVTPGSAWPGYIEKAVVSLHDKKVYTHFFPYKNTPDHPDAGEHNQMANSLIDFIDKHVKW